MRPPTFQHRSFPANPFAAVLPLSEWLAEGGDGSIVAVTEETNGCSGDGVGTGQELLPAQSAIFVRSCVDPGAGKPGPDLGVNCLGLASRAGGRS